MNQDKLNHLAVELMRLGISQAGVAQLMATAPIEEIERQLGFLPFRKAKRPGAFLIEAVRNKYSPPKEFYAQTQAHPATTGNTMDENSARGGGSPDAHHEGHRTTDHLGSASPAPVPAARSEQTFDRILRLPDRQDRPPFGGDQQSPDEPVPAGPYPQP